MSTTRVSLLYVADPLCECDHPEWAHSANRCVGEEADCSCTKFVAQGDETVDDDGE